MTASLQFETSETGNFLPSLEPRDFEEWVRAEDLARIFQVSFRRVYQLAEKGILPRARNGRWQLREAAAAYIHHLLDGGLERRGAGKTGASERALLAAAQRQRIEIKLRRETGELIPADVYRRELTSVLHSVRDNLLALPGRVGPRLANLAEQEIVKELDSAVRHALSSLAQGEGLQTNAKSAGEDRGADDLQMNAKPAGDEEDGAEGPEQVLQTSAKDAEEV